MPDLSTQASFHLQSLHKLTVKNLPLRRALNWLVTFLTCDRHRNEKGKIKQITQDEKAMLNIYREPTKMKRQFLVIRADTY